MDLSQDLFISSSPPKSTKINWRKRKLTYIIFVYVRIFMNFDTGIIPAAAVQIKEELNLPFTELAALGSLVNLGIGISCLFTGSLFKFTKPKYLLIFSLISNSIFCILFALSYNLYLLYTARIFMGFTQAFWIVYAPLWINNFSPKAYQTTWIGIFQGFSPLGIIIGYSVTCFITGFGGSWRYSLVVQGISQLIPLFYFVFMEHEEIDIENDEIVNNNQKSTIKVYEII